MTYSITRFIDGKYTINSNSFGRCELKKGINSCQQPIDFRLMYQDENDVMEDIEYFFLTELILNFILSSQLTEIFAKSKLCMWTNTNYTDFHIVRIGLEQIYSTAMRTFASHPTDWDICL